MPLSRWRSSHPRRCPSPRLEGLEPRRLLAVTLFSDGFEGTSLAGWRTRTYQGADSAPKWGVNTVKAYTGAGSAFAAGPGRNTYADDQHTGMVRENLSLAGYGSASLTFKYFINTEAGYDIFSVNVIGPDGRATNLFKDSGDDREEGWHSRTLSLNGFAGKTDLDVEFRFDSDSTLANAAPSGVWVDDVRLTADTRPATATIRGSIFDDADGDHTRDASERPLPGWVVYLDQNQNRRRDSSEWWRVTDDAGRYTFGGVAPGTYYVTQELRQGFTQTAPVRANVSGSSQFNITLHYSDSSLSSAQRSALSAAARRWSKVIVGDLPNVTDDDGVAIDDLSVDAAARDIDGPGGVLAQASPSAFRDLSGPGGDLPYRGLVELDRADVASLERSGRLQDVLTHEMAHVLGFGTMWEENNLLRNAGSSNPRFTGPVATAQYNTIFGRSESSVPVENEGGPGTHDTHWRESVFGSELLTGFIDSGVNAISRVTVGSLADLGYVVDLAAAEAYSAPGRPPPAALAGVVHAVTVGAGQTRSGLDFGNRAINQAPKIASLTDTPDPATTGSAITLTAIGATDADGSVTKVVFYRETNGAAGLQLGAGGDTIVGTDADRAGGFSVRVSTSGLAAGAHTFYALATDNAGATSATGTAAPKTTHTLQSPGTISGTVYRDTDGDGRRDAGEEGIAGVKVYLDANGNDRFDSGERTVVTDSSGRYAFTPLTAGNYTARFITPAGHVRTVPSSGRQVVQLGAGKTVSGRDFGAVAAATIGGRVFNDLDADAVRDSSDAGAANVRVYIDANNNGRLDTAEASVLTGTSGTYSLTGQRPGTHIVRFVMPSGWQLTSPYTYYTAILAAGQTRSGHDFGITQTA